MKKTILFLAIILSSVCIKAQDNRTRMDTLFLGDRDPVYYYWDTNWWDHYAINYTDKNMDWCNGTMMGYFCKPEYARYCHIDTSLRVIGIAAALELGIITTNDSYLADTFFFNKMVPEYFRLYEVDSNGDEMHLMAEGQWTPKTPPKHSVQITRRTNGYDRDYFDTIYEVYFDDPVTVYDSFYVAVTGYNSYWHSDFYITFSPPEKGWAYITIATTQYDDLHDTTMNPKPNHYKRKLHFIDEDNYDDRYEVTDTNWHTFKTIHNNHSALSNFPWNRYMYIFPIIDTSSVISCANSRELTLAYLEGSVATLTWEGGYNADHWELSICPDNCSPEDGNISTWNTRLATLQGLDTAQWYTAWVRSVCDTANLSDWSDSIRFYVPSANNEEPIRVETIADKHTYLMPNPASETVTIASSFRIGEVEIYDLNGKRLMHSIVDGMQTSINISNISGGTYIVRITTNNGTAYKKLVIK